MSIYFVRPDGQDLWNPSSATARMFHAQAESMAQLIHVESGMGPIISDEVVVDPAQFAAFASAFAAYMLKSGNQNNCFHSLLGGCFSVVLGLSSVLGLSVSQGEPRFEEHLAAGKWFVEGRRL